MTKIEEMYKVAIEDLDTDIKILTNQARLELDTTTRERILKEKLILLYMIDVVDFVTFNKYSEMMKSLIKGRL